MRSPVRTGQLEGRARVELDPEVVRLNDNGKRKVMLRIAFGGFAFEVELKDPDKTFNEISYARAWVREG